QPLIIDNSPVTCPCLYRVVKTNDNCVIVSWVRFNNYDNYALYAQKISNTGQMLWAQNGELIMESGYYPVFQLAANNIGGTYIIYYNYSASNIYGINLDANTNNLWSANPDPLIINGYVENVVSDNAGGVIINYHCLTTNESVRVVRINSNHDILWDVLIANNTPFYDLDLTVIGSGDYLVWWRYQGNVIGQRIDIEGNTYWEENGIVINDQTIYSDAEANIVGDQDNFYMTYTIEAPAPSTDKIFKIQKYDLDANAVWENGTILSASYCYYTDLIVDTDQNYYITWKQDYTIYSQKVDTDGNKLWGDEGVVLDSSAEFEWTQGGLQINELNGNLFYMWQPIYDHHSFLLYQVLGANGNFLLPEDGIEIQSGLYTTPNAIYNYRLIGNDESGYCLWEDLRSGQYRIFAQRTSPEGVDYFPEFGITITDTAFHAQTDFVAVDLPEGGVAIAWSEVKENEELKRVRWQILSPDGTLHNPNGIDITNNVVSDQTDPQIDVVDDEIIIAWMEDDKIKVQKLVNYFPVWGDNGSLLVENGNTEHFLLEGNYIKFDFGDVDYFHRIDENGNLASGWATPGVELTLSSYSIKNMNYYNDDLVFCWQTNNSGIKSYGFQILNSEGEYAFLDNGFVIAENVTYFDHIFLFDGCINLFHEDETGSYFVMERYDLEGNVIWDGITIPADDFYFYQEAVKIGDNFLFVWCNTFDGISHSFMMQMIDAEGNLLPSHVVPDDFRLYSDRSDFQLVSTTDNDAAILFQRGYDVSSDTSFFLNGMVMYNVSASDVPINENEIVNTAKCRLSNYPNPFNPSTTISFNLTAKSAKDAKIEIYNSKGQKVKVLECSNFFAANTRESYSNCSVTWNGDNENNNPVASGIYLYKLVAGEKELAAKKMLLLK
ncbi:MAG TPA: T9SS type A sorting domain-containing protein, partial [Candidatus Cloacimonadota bacterium]|nr:T9SS type A sorting domain-containing protein [Candidatus Cloacimonadota bacterium]